MKVESKSLSRQYVSIYLHIYIFKKLFQKDILEDNYKKLLKNLTAFLFMDLVLFHRNYYEQQKEPGTSYSPFLGCRISSEVFFL